MEGYRRESCCEDKQHGGRDSEKVKKRMPCQSHGAEGVDGSQEVNELSESGE
ncbi:hypothetical protein A2U01_0053128 [Trifolium medium]|uniref:Uncharacterized protein n=1 Tax=Trifolium medium TaxID=97028 RepID=A0A392R7S5_9FABA|nr:hypothetical protein [Trifolium medium]